MFQEKNIHRVLCAVKKPFKQDNHSTFALARSATPPLYASIRWSQWIVEGTATLGSPLEMN